MYVGRKPKRRSRRLILLLLILIAAASSGAYYLWAYQPDWSRPFEPTPTPTRTAQSYILEAEAYYGQGQLDEAIAAYEQAVAISPKDTSAGIRLAELLILRQRTVEALAQAEQAVLLEPSNPQALAILCLAFDWEGHYAEAFEACECAIELEPDYAEALAYLARVYVDTGDWIPARQFAQQAVDSNYQSMAAHASQGYVLEAQGRYRQAVQAYENAIVLQPKLASLYLSAGQNYRVLGQFNEAIDRFERAIRLDPSDPVGYDQLGWTHYAAGQYGRAIETLEQATLIDPDHASSWGHLGIAYYVLQQYEDAIRALEQAIRLSERDYLGRARRVVVLGQDSTGDPPQFMEVMAGDFPSPDGREDQALTADLLPVLSQARFIPEPDQTCGDLIAHTLRSQSSPSGLENRPKTANAADGAGPSATPAPYARFLDARGQAKLDLAEGLIQVELTGVPQPESLPYEAKVLLQPDTELSLGYFQPDTAGNASLDFGFKDVRSAPVDYYTLLGFSYVFLDQCDKGIPRLLDSLDIDPSPSNPAWQGLTECPETPAPDETPTPDTS